MFDLLRTTLRRLQKKLRPRQRKEVVVSDIDVGFDYLELASRCQTQNEFNRLHIGLENLCSPREIAEIAKLADSCGSFEATRSWLKNFLMWTPELFETPQRYGRHTISRHMIVYQSSESKEWEKDLLIAFTGNARRPGMPVCVFLQFLDSRSWDVVVLKKCSRNSYLLGLEGISADFPGLVRVIQTRLSPMQYRRVITLGTSGGGFAAVLAAVLMEADRGICVGGTLPISYTSEWTSKVTDNGRDLRFVYGKDFLRDRVSAVAMANVFGGRLHPIAGVDQHVVLGQLLKSNKLAEFFREMLA